MVLVTISYLHLKWENEQPSLNLHWGMMGRWLLKQIWSWYFLEKSPNTLACMKLSKQQYISNQIQYVVNDSQQIKYPRNSDKCINMASKCGLEYFPFCLGMKTKMKLHFLNTLNFNLIFLFVVLKLNFVKLWNHISTSIATQKWGSYKKDEANVANSAGAGIGHHYIVGHYGYLS